MTEVDDGGMRVLGHRVAGAELGTSLADHLTGRGVLIFEEAGVALCFALSRSNRNEEAGNALL